MEQIIQQLLDQIKVIAEKKKRPKLVYKNISEISHLWIHESQPEAKCRNAHYRDGIIYSYGEHFPIARIVRNRDSSKLVLFTLDTYSSTTAGHIRDVEAATGHVDKLYMVDVPRYGEPRHETNIRYWARRIGEFLDKIPKARESKRYILGQANYEKNQLVEYLEYYKLKADKDTKKVIAACSREKWEQHIGEYEKKAADRKAYQEEHWDEVQEKRSKDRIKRQEAKIATAEKKYKEQIDEWRAGKGYRLNKGYGMPDLLRYKDGRIETSQCVQVPVEAARRLYTRIQKVVAKGGCDDNCPDKILDYQVKEISADRLVVGCHRIPMSEVQAIAREMK